MLPLSIRLFGKLSVSYNGSVVCGLEACKVQEILSYLLLYRNSSHTRDRLASLLWGDSTTAQSKKYLRQTLWQIRTALREYLAAQKIDFLLAGGDWVRLNPAAQLWLDVAAFEDAFAEINTSRGASLGHSQAATLREAVNLYQGDLLEGCYQDWCLYERERLQSDYLLMLDKLMGYCEEHHEYEKGLDYGHRVLRYDRARESTHRQLMLLYYMAGDRTSALRQYARCVAALAEELSVKPARHTVELYEQIRADSFEKGTRQQISQTAAPLTETSQPEMIHHLKQLREVLTDIQRQVQQEIQAVDVALNGRY